MRKLVLFLISVGASGCGAIPFDVDQPIPEQRVEGSTLGGLLPGFLQSPVPITINIRSETEKRGTGPARSANLKLLTLAVTPHDAPSGNFDFLDEAHIFVRSPGNGSLPRVEIATLAPVPKGRVTMSFDVVPGVDLLPYVNAGAEIESTASGRRPARDVTFDGRVVVTVRF